MRSITLATLLVLAASAPVVGFAQVKGDAAAGKEVFSANCAGCHTLADAGAAGAVGPNLDDLGGASPAPPAALVVVAPDPVEAPGGR